MFYLDAAPAIASQIKDTTVKWRAFCHSIRVHNRTQLLLAKTRKQSCQSKSS